MASFAPIRGTKTQIENTPKVDGQFLIETDQGNQNKIYVDTFDSGTSSVERSMAGGGGHQILPTIEDPTDIPNEEKVVEQVNIATPMYDKIPSLYGIQQWTNEKTKRFMIEGAPTNSPIGQTGIGSWISDASSKLIEASPVGTDNPYNLGWYEVNNSTHLYQATTDTSVVTDKKYWTSVIDESTWFYVGTIAEIDTADSNGIEVAIKYDPSTNEPITLGGYIIDTDTGRICIRFANMIFDTEHAKVGVNITYTRNEVA